MDKPPEVTPLASPTGAGPPGADLTGRTLGDFRILRRLGQGGMGQVYLAEQLSLRRKVALKFLRPDLAADEAALKRFTGEAHAVAQLVHANVVQVYAISACDGLPFMALEYVEGKNLREHVERKGPPTVLQALSIMRQVAAALQRASELGIVHRDIKPENILLTRKGEVKVTDFGLSRCLAGEGQPLRLTQSGITMGTPLYMSPEQVQGQPIDARTDIYSFGVTCYHMLAGQPPFRGENPFEVALRHVNAEPEPLSAVRPDLPPELCMIVHKMMAKQPEQRYASCRDLIKDLVRLRERLAQAGGPQHTQALSLDSAPALPAALSTPVAAAPTGGPLPVARRRRLLPAFLLSLAAALALGAGAGWLWRQHDAAARAPAPADDTVTVPEAFQSLARREQFLKEAVDQYANPDRDQVRLGLMHCEELGLFYLEQGRLDDADAFFRGLARPSQKVLPYRFLGQLGQAIVLGLQNRPGASNQQFQEILLQPVLGGERQMAVQFLRANPRVHEWVARALDYNLANQTSDHPFPAKLEPFRHFAGMPAPRGGDKNPGKK
jgi:serine/threonine-protein kinase